MNLLSAPLDAFYEAVFLTDGDGLIHACNERAKVLFHATEDAVLVGRNLISLFVHPQQGLDFLSELKTGISSTPFTLIEARLAREDGRSFIAEIAVHRRSESQMMISMRDITVRVEALRHLEEANERLRMTDRGRMTFVSNVSHELRSPLTSMSYALTNMQRGICGPLPDKAMAYIERLQTDVRRLLLTVNDILDMRQIEMGTLKLHKTSASIKKLLIESIEALHIQAEAKQQTLTITTCEDDCFAMVDTHKIERIFSNVIANAIKYTQSGGSISISIQRESDVAQIRIDDNGIGIPPESLSRVVQPYFRVGDHVAGTGLGLSIVKELVELHQGRLKLFSPVPESTTGTRVQLTIPLSNRPVWVILSGDEAFLSNLTQMADLMGCTAIPDSSALNIEDVCKDFMPSRFLIDGSLPESSVEDIIYQIHKSMRLAKTPIVILAPQDFDPLRNYTYAQMRIDVRTYPTSPDVLRQL